MPIKGHTYAMKMKKSSHQNFVPDSLLEMMRRGIAIDARMKVVMAPPQILPA